MRVAALGVLALLALVSLALAQMVPSGGPMIPGGVGPMVPSGSGGTVAACGESLPSVTGLVPSSGSSSGGISITINGTQFGGLVGAAAVKFDAVNATSYGVISCTTIVAVVPAHAVGVVDVTVTNPIGTSPIVVADQFTYTSCSNSMDFTQACNSAYIGAF